MPSPIYLQAHPLISNREPLADHSSADMNRAVSEFNEQMGHIAELFILLVMGAILAFDALPDSSVTL